MEDVERAWLAGFFDGEGSVTANLETHVPILQLTQKDISILQYIQKISGTGKIYTNQRGISNLHIHKKSEVLTFIDLVLDFVKQKKQKLLIAQKLGRAERKDQRLEDYAELVSLREGVPRGRKQTLEYPRQTRDIVKLQDEARKRRTNG